MTTTSFGSWRFLPIANAFIFRELRARYFSGSMPTSTSVIARLIFPELLSRLKQQHSSGARGDREENGCRIAHPTRPERSEAYASPEVWTRL
jgi:hypothetical protein